VFTGTARGPGYARQLSTSERVGVGVGDAGILIAGVSGVYSGIKQGGGGLNAASSALGTAAALDPEPISKAVLAIAALATGIASSILGDPKKLFDEAQTRVLDANKFKAPTAQDRGFDIATGSDQFSTNF